MVLVEQWPFGAELGRLAREVAGVSDVADEVAVIAASALRPVTVAVHGRRGVGTRTVARALRRRGVPVAVRAAADVAILVVAEACKPEDRALCAEVGAALVVVTKADLLGAAGEAPIAAADRVATDVGAATGLPAVAVVGLLAAVEALDDGDVAALRSLIAVPVDMSSVDAFADSGDTGRRLLDRLDRFGIAHAVLALTDDPDGPDATDVVRRLHDVSRIDALVAAVAGAAAPIRYRRTVRAIDELSCLATGSAEIADFLTADDTVLARMAAAVDVVESMGAHVDRTDTAAAHRERALHWDRHRCGPTSALHRACASDLVRGSLRLLDEAR